MVEGAAVKPRTEFWANILGVAAFGIFFVGLGVYGFTLALNRPNAAQWWILGAASILVGASIIYRHVAQYLLPQEKKAGKPVEVCPFCGAIMEKGADCIKCGKQLSAQPT
jgi:hypothetical protein